MAGVRNDPKDKRYMCKSCGKPKVDEDERVKFSKKEVYQTLDLYTEDNGIRRVARILTAFYKKKFANNTILQWIRKYRLKFVNFEVGRCDVHTFKKLWNKLKNNVIKCICTDECRVYKDELPVNIPHVESKSEACLVKTHNSLVRYHFARLNRKTNYYSKSGEMLRLSISLLLHKDLAFNLL